MSPFIIKTLQLLLSLSFLVIIHELGHFIPARLFKCRVERFFLFFDVKFALWKKKIGDTLYGIGWLPLGGYVKIAGMIDESMDVEQMKQPPQPWEFRSKPTWQRLIIMLGGVIVNIVAGFLIYMMILHHWGSTYLPAENIKYGFAVTPTMEKFGFRDGDVFLEVNGAPFQDNSLLNQYLLVRDVSKVKVRHEDGTEEVLELPEDIGSQLFHADHFPAVAVRYPFVIDSIAAESPAEKSGLKAGDRIIGFNETKISYYSDFTKAMKVNEGNPLSLTVLRAQDTIMINTTPDGDNKIGFFAVASEDNFVKPVTEQYNLFQSIQKGFSYGYWTLHDYVVQFKYVFTKKGVGQLGGFGAIGSIFPPVWDWEGFWRSTALISIILAFMNILPIPALDGGHVMFLLYEMLTGRKPSDKFLEYAQMIGFFLLIALVLYANGNDIVRWLTS